MTWDASTIREGLLEAECLIRALEHDVKSERTRADIAERKCAELEARIEELARVVEQETAALETIERYLDHAGVE